MTLLTICQDAADEIGFNRPSAIIDSTDPIARQLLRLANREGESLSQEYPPWQILVKEHTFTLVTSDQDYALPSDFRYIIPDTSWNRDDSRMVVNPISSRDWQYFKGWSSSFGLNMRARIRNNQLEFEQTIAAGDNGETVAFEYVSNQWCEDSGGTGQTAWAADSDVCRLDEELVTQGLVWRLKRAKGLDWEGDFQLYEKLKRKMLGRDHGSRTIDMGGDNMRLSMGVNIPEDGHGT